MAMIRRQSKASDKIPTSSMADIAFLLLIFFLVTTVFDEEKGLQVVLPEAQPEEIEVSPKNLLFFFVDGQGVVRVRHGENPQEQRITHTRVEGIMRQALASNPQVIAAVQTAPAARYVDMMNVLDGIQSAGATRFSLQLLRE
jgi:biopolymer transport protein ExbD